MEYIPICTCAGLVNLFCETVPRSGFNTAVVFSSPKVIAKSRARARSRTGTTC